ARGPAAPASQTQHVALERQRPLAGRCREGEGLDAQLTRAREHQRCPLADQGRQLVVEERPRIDGPDVDLGAPAKVERNHVLPLFRPSLAPPARGGNPRWACAPISVSVWG